MKWAAIIFDKPYGIYNIKVVHFNSEKDAINWLKIDNNFYLMPKSKSVVPRFKRSIPTSKGYRNFYARLITTGDKE